MEEKGIDLTGASPAVIKALIGVQKHVLKAVKDGTNTFFNGAKYATLSSILDAIREPLTENGFALVQESTSNDTHVSVVTKLFHESGGVLVSPPLMAPLRPEFNKTGKELPPSVQQVGSLVTYLRRYSLSPFLGVTFEDDDDGNEVSGVKDRGPAPDKRETPEPAKKEPAATKLTQNKSVYTGEVLNTPEAVARHKAAAEAAKSKDTKSAEPEHKPEPEQKGAPEKDPLEEVEHVGLRTAMARDIISVDQLTGYLNGSFGKPKMAKPVLAGKMKLNSLGEPIIKALLTGVSKADGKPNWTTVVNNIKSDPDYVPF